MRIEIKYWKFSICSFLKKIWKWIVVIGVILGIIASFIAIRSCFDKPHEQPSEQIITPKNNTYTVNSTQYENNTYTVSPIQYDDSSKVRMVKILEDPDGILSDMRRQLEVSLNGLNLILVDYKLYPKTLEEYCEMIIKKRLPIPDNNYFFTEITCESNSQVTITCKYFNPKTEENTTELLRRKTIMELHSKTFHIENLKDTHGRNALINQFANELIRKIKDKENREV